MDLHHPHAVTLYGGRRAADRRLLADIEGSLRACAQRAGDRLACRPGCSACCLGPFPITALDAVRLQAGLHELARHEPRRAAAIHTRAVAAARAMSEGFPGDAATGLLGEDVKAEEAFCLRHGATPCPALDPASGRCELYESRPISCRTFGPPVRIGDQELPPCSLCFKGTPAHEVERCRFEPDPTGIEDELLSDLEAEDGVSGETMIAFALATASLPPVQH